MKRVCETCKYEDYDLFGEPCRSCEIGPNQNWEPKEVLRTVTELEESIEAILVKNDKNN